KLIVLEALKQQPQLLMDVVKVLAKELRRCEDQHVLILDNEILVRVAQALIYLKDLHPHHNWTRQEIANFCASTVSTVIKALSELEEMGLISQNGRSISILKRDKLVAMQDEDLK
ncbi:MAG: Crp/Fnr family transcriptional regulator, partial [Bdellovibrionales bacterium]